MALVPKHSFPKMVVLAFLFAFAANSVIVAEKRQKPARNPVFEKVRPLVDRDLVKAMEFYKKKQFLKARPLFSEILVVCLANNGEEHPAVGVCYNALGVIAYNDGDYDKALKYFRKALAIDIKTFGAEHSNLAVSYDSIGQVFMNIGEYDRAIECHQKSLEIKLRGLGPEHSEVAFSYTALGRVLQKKNDHEKAIKYYEKALAVNVRNNGPEHASVAACYEDLGKACYRNSDHAKAISYLKKALTLKLKTHPPDHPDVSDIYNHLGMSYSSIDYEKSVIYLKKDLAIQLKIYGPDNPIIATCYNILGITYRGKGEFGEAIACSEKALAIQFKALGPEDPDISVSLNNLGTIYRMKGDYEKAIGYNEQSLAILSKAFGPEHPQVALGLSNLGVAYQLKGEYSKALGFFENALAIKLKAYGPEHHLVAGSYLSLGQIHQVMSEFSKAEELFEKALAIWLKQFGPNHFHVASSYNNLGVLSNDMGESEKAIIHFRKTLAIRLRNHGPEHHEVATVYNNLGWAYHSIREHDRAIEFFGKALAILLKALGPEHPTVATSYNNIGSCYDAKNDRSEAIRYHEKALAIRLKALGPDHPEVAGSFGNLGLHYTKVGQHDRAMNCLEKSLAISLKKFGPEHVTVSTCYLNIGGVHRAGGAWVKAIEYERKALAIELKVLGPEHPSVANCYLNLGASHIRGGELDKGRGFYEKALAIRLKTLGPEHPDLAMSYYSVGASHYLKKELVEALRFARLSNATTARFITGVFSYLSSAQRLDFQRNQYTFHLLGNIGEASSLAQAMLRRKGLVLDSILEDSALANGSNDPLIRELLQERRAMTAQWGNLGKDLSGRDTQSNVGTFLSRREDLSDRMEKLESRITKALGGESRARRAMQLETKDLANTLRRGQAFIDFLHYPHIVNSNNSVSSYAGIGTVLNMENGFCTITQLLSKGSAEASGQLEPKDIILKIAQGEKAFVDLEKRTLVEIVNLLKGPVGTSVRLMIKPHADPSSLKIVTLKRAKVELPSANSLDFRCGAVLHVAGSNRPLWVPLGSVSQIAPKVSGLRASLSRGGFGTKSISQQLHQLVIEPILRRLPQETKTLIICPDAGLNFLSFPSLIDREGKFLCEKYEILHVSSGRDLIFGRDNRNAPSKEAVLFADPSFGGKEENSSKSPEYLAFDPPTREAMRDLSFATLEGSKREAEQVGRIVSRFGMRAKSLIGIEATEEALRKVHSPRILHLATHGFFIPKEEVEEKPNRLAFFQKESRSRASNPMHRSGLALAGAKRTLELWGENKPHPANDGILTAEEAGMLDLSGTWLTVLSACDTGSGVARAGEGVLGLRRAFAMAGTQNLLLTLWPVSDSFTKDFMVSFYEEALKTGNAPRAMAKVQKDWLVKLREERSVGQAVKLAGPFVLTFRGGLN